MYDENIFLIGMVRHCALRATLKPHEADRARQCAVSCKPLPRETIPKRCGNLARIRERIPDKKMHVFHMTGDRFMYYVNFQAFLCDILDSERFAGLTKRWYFPVVVVAR